MPTYTADHSGDWAHHEGVETASYTDPDGNTDTAIKVKRGDLTQRDLAGATFAIAPRDTAFFIWPATISGATLNVDGALTIDGTTWILVGCLWSRNSGSLERWVAREGR